LHLGEENFDWIVFVNGKLHKELSKVSIENVEFLSFNYALNDDKHKEVFEKYFNTIASKNRLSPILTLLTANTVLP
jgi:Fe-S cluster assembly protein SufD